MKALIERLAKGFDRAMLRQAQLDLLQPNYKYKVTVAIERNGDIRVFAPNVATKAEAKEICTGLLRGASILAFKSGLNLVIGKEPV